MAKKILSVVTVTAIVPVAVMIPVAIMAPIAVAIEVASVAIIIIWRWPDDYIWPVAWAQLHSLVAAISAPVSFISVSRKTSCNHKHSDDQH
jgi:hypothetical protein